MNESLMLTINIFATILLSGVFVWRIAHLFYEYDDDFVCFMMCVCSTLLFIFILGVFWRWW